MKENADFQSPGPYLNLTLTVKADPKFTLKVVLTR